MKTQSKKLIGQKFNMGTVIDFCGREKRGKRAGLVWLVKCECGNIYKATTTELTCCRKKNCGCIKHNRYDNLNKKIGDKYGNLTVIDIDGKRNSSGKLYRKCLCDCGQQKYVTLGNLKSGNVSSCGCKSKRQGKNHPLWMGHEEISKRYWSRIKLNAKKRNLEFSISIEEAWDQWIKQDKKCALSGQSLLHFKCKGNNSTASLDRIDSSKGYVFGNIQWIHKDINKIKTDFNNDRFIEICNLVSNFNKFK